MSRADVEIDVRDVQQLPVERALVESAVRATVALAGGERGDDCAASGGSGEQVQVSVLLTNDVHIADLNRAYRGIDEPTDVLAFPQADDGERALEGGALGDVVVSVERGYEQASEAGRRPETEICELVAHGVLHLIGFTDDAAEGRQAMLERQHMVLAGLGLEEGQ